MYIFITSALVVAIAVVGVCTVGCAGGCAGCCAGGCTGGCTDGCAGGCAGGLLGPGFFGASGCFGGALGLLGVVIGCWVVTVCAMVGGGVSGCSVCATDPVVDTDLFS